jgi:hypothetical protein
VGSTADTVTLGVEVKRQDDVPAPHELLLFLFFFAVIFALIYVGIGETFGYLQGGGWRSK